MTLAWGKGRWEGMRPGGGGGAAAASYVTQSAHIKLLMSGRLNEPHNMRPERWMTRFQAIPFKPDH